MFHCHIEWHLEMGMSLLIKVKSSERIENLNIISNLQIVLKRFIFIQIIILIFADFE
jgi:hypothetical protein